MNAPHRAAVRHQSHSPACIAGSNVQFMASLVRWPLLLLLVLGLAACEKDGAPVAESQYSTMLVGDWMGTVEGNQETVSYRADGGFSAQLRPMGFISNTLGQGATGTVSGTWVLQGKVITLTIDEAENEQLLNSAATSTITNFKENELVVTTASGETSTFVRAL